MIKITDEEWLVDLNAKCHANRQIILCLAGCFATLTADTNPLIEHKFQLLCHNLLRFKCLPWN